MLYLPYMRLKEASCSPSKVSALIFKLFVTPPIVIFVDSLLVEKSVNNPPKCTPSSLSALVAVSALPCKFPANIAAFTIPFLQSMPTAVLLVYGCSAQAVVKETPNHDEITRFAKSPPTVVPESVLPLVI